MSRVPFFLSVDLPLRWTSTLYESTEVILADDDDVAQSIISQSNGLHSCVFSDGDDPQSFSDSVPGFILAAGTTEPIPSGGTTCVLVLMD